MDRKHFAKGLCKPCYDLERRLVPENQEKARAAQKKWKSRPDSAERNRAAQAKWRRRPESKEKMRAYTSAPEYLEKVREKYPNSDARIYSMSRNSSSKYGMTEEQRDERLRRQNNCCARCGVDFSKCRIQKGRGRAWCIDHDHGCCPRQGSCGKCVRGLICHPCNRYIGLLELYPERFEMDERTLRYVNGSDIQKAA